LTSDHLAQLADARSRARRVLRAASGATLGGWTLAVFGVLTALCGLTDPPSLVLAGGMGAVAYNEFRGAAMLRGFELAAPVRLARGQAALAVLIAAYAVWRIGAAMRGPSSAGSSDPQVDAVLADMKLDGLVRSITVALYAGVGLTGAIVPGLTALYYRSRSKHLRSFLAQTPPWVVRAMRQ
jgi:hypothetical protein